MERLARGSSLPWRSRKDAGAAHDPVAKASGMAGRN